MPCMYKYSWDTSNERIHRAFGALSAVIINAHKWNKEQNKKGDEWEKTWEKQSIFLKSRNG